MKRKKRVEHYDPDIQAKLDDFFADAEEYMEGTDELIDEIKALRSRFFHIRMRFRLQKMWKRLFKNKL